MAAAAVCECVCLCACVCMCVGGGGGEEGSQFDPHLWFFQKLIFWREGEALFFCDY